MFWDLLYWKFLGTPHCLDIMHIIKNVCESLLATLLNMLEKTKDGIKERKDLITFNIREELQILPGEGDEPEEEPGKKRKQREYYFPHPASL